MNVIALLLFAVMPGQSATDAIDRSADSVLALMTVEEKIGQLNQVTPRWDRPSGDPLRGGLREAVEKGVVGSLLNLTGAAETRIAQEAAVQKSRLGIPLVFGFDVVHGFATTFPIPLAEACTWDPSAVERSARIAATEASAAGIHWTFAPMVDIARDARWGRITEGSGEDPYLGSVMAAARVRGFQGANLADPGSILACAKHFAAYGGAEAGREYNTVDISERTLREVYLPPFKAAVDAGVGSLMSSFNEIAGIPSTANRHLLTDILRDEWKFKGFVVSDWNAIGELRYHGIADDTAEAALRAITAGVDMDMASEAYRLALPFLLRSGQVPMAMLDAAVHRVLREKFALGLFDDPYRNCDTVRQKQMLLRPEHRAAARAIARESIVLLKNDANILPLKPTIHTIAVIGPLADSKDDPLGAWSGAGDSNTVISILEGIRERAGSDVRVLFARGCSIEGGDTSGFREAADIAEGADVVLLVIGEGRWMSGEAASRSTVTLPGVQEALASAVTATGVPVVAVLMNGRPLAIPGLAATVPAIVEAWYPGVEAGHAVADVLFGDVNPSGKLCVSFPRSTGQLPLYYGQRNTGRPAAVGDPYTSKYLDIPNTPLFPFGHGVSYTTFKYDHLAVTSLPPGRWESKISVRVMNMGSRKGDEVVQLYIRRTKGSVTRPVRELKGFKRITLESHDSQIVEFTLNRNDLAYYDAAMRWVCEPGIVQIFVGGSSIDTIEGHITVGAR